MNKGLAFVLLAIAMGQAVGEESPTSFLDVAHPGRVSAVEKVRRGTEAYRQDDLHAALEALEGAVADDPLLSPAWVNFSAAQIKACHPIWALFAAQTAHLLDPEEPAASHNLQEAQRLTCPGEKPPSEVETGIMAVGKNPADPIAWVAAAAAFRFADRHLLAAFCEERALARGGGDKNRMAGDLEQAGLLRAARAVFEALSAADSKEKILAIDQRLTKVRPSAESLGGQVAAEAGVGEFYAVEQAIQVAEVLLLRGLTVEDANRELHHLLGMEGELRMAEGPWGSATLEPNWHNWDPPGDPGSPLALIRRFPGDTQIALYPWHPFENEKPENTLLRLFSARSPVLAGSWRDCAPGPGSALCRVLPVTLDFGMEGRDQIEIFLFENGPGKEGLFAATLSGSGGCGEPCRNQANQALAAQLSRLQIKAGAPLSSFPASGALFPLPAAWQAERTHSEMEDPWRTFSLGGDLTIDLPPGLCVAKISGVFRDSSAGPWTQLWFRGEFVDQEKKKVVIGNSTIGGWVDVRSQQEGNWDMAVEDPASLAPRLDPEAKFIKAASLQTAREKAGVGGEALAARFQGKIFPGEWLVFRCRLGTECVDVVIPVASGTNSLALFWIPTMVRRENQQVPPPVTDLVHPYQIRFDRIPEKNRGADPREGLLVGGGLKVAVPKGFKVSMSPSTREGFPISLRNPDGSVLILEKLAPRPDASVEVRRQEVVATMGEVTAEGWKTGPKFRGGILEWAGLVPHKENEGVREVILLQPIDYKEEPAYRMLLQRGGGEKEENWRFLRQTLLDSFRSQKK